MQFALFLLRFSYNILITTGGKRQQPRLLHSAHVQLGVIPLLRDDGGVSNTSISTERCSLIKVLLITVMLHAPLGVAEGRML